MSDPFSFWSELRRRRVVRAVSLYAVVAWGAVQVADTFFPALRMPEWTITVVAVLAVLGFPVTVAVAWIYDRTATGLERTDAAPVGEGSDQAVGRSEKGQFFSAMGLGALVGVLVVGTVLWVAGGKESEATVVAVLPFETVGTANPTFSEGIHGDVLTALSSVTGIDVIARSSVRGYEDRAQPVAEVAGELGAGWVLRGEVQQVGSQVRVHARLVDVRTGRQRWAQAFRRELTAANLFDIQGEITAEIVAALEDRLAGTPVRAAERRSTDDLEAYRLYVQGRGLLSSREEVPMRRAVDYFDRALAIDSAYAVAWAGLADALTYLETFGYSTPDVGIDAREAAERALELDPSLAEAHFALANLAHAERRNDEAVRRLNRAIDLRPSYADAYNLLSWIHKLHGRVGASEVAARRAVDLDPLGSAPLANLALAYLAAGDPASALGEAIRIQDLHPDFHTGTFLQALALYHRGWYEHARPLLDSLDVPWAGPAPRTTLALVHAALGDTVDARETLASIDPDAHPFSVGLVRAALGEAAPADAFEGVDRWDYWPTLAARYLFPDILGPARADPAFDAVLRAIDQSWQ